ncbi:MAG: ATP-binding protein, partial [Leptospiraceae bacterium]|nr:ATP-binding protein [Leptospiraceae bacterium]
DTYNMHIENELFKTLRKIGVESQIIMYSNQITEDIQYKKQIGIVYDFVNKLDGISKLIQDSQEAIIVYKKYHELSLKMHQENEAYRRELDWLIWQYRKEQHNKYYLGKTIMETLAHSIFQGMGMGAAVSLIDLLNYSKQDEGEYVKVKKNLFENLVKNLAPIKLIKEKLDKMIHILDKKFLSETINPDKLNILLYDSISETEEFRKIKNQTTVVEKLQHFHPIIANLELLGLTFRELLTNAYKYSPEDSKVYITRGYHSSKFSLLFINSIMKVSKGVQGIPPELENEIFEPFFRINRIYDERFYQEELGFGLGLSILRRGLYDIGGELFVYEGIDYVTSNEPIKKIIAELLLPFA